MKTLRSLQAAAIGVAIAVLLLGWQGYQGAGSQLVWAELWSLCASR